MTFSTVCWIFTKQLQLFFLVIYLLVTCNVYKSVFKPYNCLQFSWICSSILTIFVFFCLTYILVQSLRQVNQAKLKYLLGKFYLEFHTNALCDFIYFCFPKCYEARFLFAVFLSVDFYCFLFACLS